MAGRDGLRHRNKLRHRPDGERAQLRDHRPVLLPQQGLPEPDLRRLRRRRVVPQHKGHVRRAEPADTLRLQRHRRLHRNPHVGGGAAAVRRRIGRRPFLLERLWDSGDADDTADRLLARRNTEVDIRSRVQLLRDSDHQFIHK